MFVYRRSCGRDEMFRCPQTSHALGHTNIPHDRTSENPNLDDIQTSHATGHTNIHINFKPQNIISLDKQEGKACIDLRHVMKKQSKIAKSFKVGPNLTYRQIGRLIKLQFGMIDREKSLLPVNWLYMYVYSVTYKKPLNCSDI